MGVTLSTYAEVLKEDYKPQIRDQLNHRTIFWDRVKTNVDNFDAVGKRAFMALRTGRNFGVGARKEGGVLPTAGNQQYDNAFFNTKFLYGRIQISGPSKSASKNNTGAFIKALDSEMTGLVRDLGVDINRQAFHDGSGVLAKADTTLSATTTFECNSTKFLEVEMPVVFVADVTDGTTGTNVVTTVSSITDTDTCVLGTAVTGGTNSVLIRGDAFTSAGRDVQEAASNWTTPLEIWGLETICNTANPGNGLGGAAGRFGEIDRSANSWWQANILNNGGTERALSLLLMQTAYDESEIEGDAVPGLILTDHACKRKYGSLLTPDKRYPAGGDIELDGGYRGLEFNGVPLVADKDASLTDGISAGGVQGAFNRLYFLTMSTFERHVGEDWQWMDEDGAMLSRVANQDAYEATMYSYQQLGCDRPNANTVLDDIDPAL